MSQSWVLGAWCIRANLVVALLVMSFAVTAEPGQAAVPEPASSQAERPSCAMPRSGEYDKADPAATGLDPAKLRRALAYAEAQNSLSLKVFFVSDFDHPPGAYFEYDEVGPSLLTYVVQRAIWRHEPGLDFQEFAQRELFDQLGIPRSAYFWQRDRAGNTEGYSQLFLRPLKFGRLGQLWLTDGRYQGRQIISTRFMREFRTPSKANCGFGFFVWLNSCRPGQPQANIDIPIRRQFPGEPWVASAPRDMVFAVGLGTRTFVIPSLDLVITHSGEQELDTVPSATMLNIDGVVSGRTGEAGTHEFFRLLMVAVTDMQLIEPGLVGSAFWRPSGPGDTSANAEMNTVCYGGSAASCEHCS